MVVAVGSTRHTFPIGEIKTEDVWQQFLINLSKRPELADYSFNDDGTVLIVEPQSVFFAARGRKSDDVALHSELQAIVAQAYSAALGLRVGV